MIEFELTPFLNPPPFQIRGEVLLGETSIMMKYILEGDFEDISFPLKSCDPIRKDELWKETCFEFFLGQFDSSKYYEYNFSPSGDWSCYQFLEYRSEPINEYLNFIPTVSSKQNAQCFTLSVNVPLPDNFKFNRKLGISVITKDKAEKYCFWSLSHPRNIPDFHDRRAFSIDLN
jgi:hypothetical protein